jgi:hypothetical protein
MKPKNIKLFLNKKTKIVVIGLHGGTFYNFLAVKDKKIPKNFL